MDNISIIVPLQNKEKHISQCLNSLLKQSYSSFTIIIVENDSVDSSLAIAQSYQEKYPHKIKLIVHPNAGGLGGARNVGIHHAKGPWIIFVDADDYVSPDCLESLMNAQKKYKVSMVVANIADFYSKQEDKPKIDICYPKETLIHQGQYSFHFRYHMRLNAVNTLYYLPFFKQHQLFFEENTKVAEDQVFNVVNLLLNDCVLLNKATYYYRHELDGQCLTNDYGAILENHLPYMYQRYIQAIHRHGLGNLMQYRFCQQLSLLYEIFNFKKIWNIYIGQNKDNMQKTMDQMIEYIEADARLVKAWSLESDFLKLLTRGLPLRDFLIMLQKGQWVCWLMMISHSQNLWKTWKYIMRVHPKDGLIQTPKVVYLMFKASLGAVKKKIWKY